MAREEKDNGLASYGEVAPTPGFSDCSLDDFLPEARAWVRGESPNHSPLFLSALSCLSSEIWRTVDGIEGKPVLCSGLDASGENVPSLTLKRKIGMGSPKDEIDEILGWMSNLPDRSKVRLDANGSLNVESLRLWVDALEGLL